MKKAFLMMSSSLAFMSMVAAPGADLKDGVKAAGTRVDRVTQTQALMSALSADGFGLDAEEYELLMGREFDMLDDLAGSITMPSCAGDGPDLQRKPKDWDEPIPRPVPGFPHAVTDLPVSGGSPLDGMIKGTVRPGSQPTIGGSCPTKPVGPIEPIATINNGNGIEDNVKGSVGDGKSNGDFPNVAPGGSNGNGSGDEGVDGSRPTRPIGPGPIDF